MKYNPLDFTLNEIITVNRDYLTCKFFKLHVINKDYVILLSRVGAALTDIEIYNINHQINENNPIEHEIISYHQQHGNFSVDFSNQKSFSHKLYVGDFLENYEFELSELRPQTINYLHNFHKNDNLTLLISNYILYKNLKDPKCVFEEKFGKFIYEICLRRISDNHILQKKLVDMKKRIKEEKESKKHLDEAFFNRNTLNTTKNYDSKKYPKVKRLTEHDGFIEKFFK